jgi:hypothetical protein
MGDDDGSDSDAMSDESSSTAASSEESGGSATSDPSSEEGSSSAAPEESSSGGATGDTGAPLYSASGHVVRLESAAIAEGNDGIGTLFIGAFPTCAHGEAPIGFFALPEADFSSESNMVPWTIDNLPAGPIHFGLFLDDDGDVDPANPLPGPGDPSYADDVCDGILSCLEFEIADGDLVDAELVLNMTHTRCPR